MEHVANWYGRRFESAVQSSFLCGLILQILFIEPIRGWRRVKSYPPSTRIEWVQEVRLLLEVDYLDARKVKLVCDIVLAPVDRIGSGILWTQVDRRAAQIQHPLHRTVRVRCRLEHDFRS